MLEGVPVNFYKGSALLGSAVSNNSGVASLSYAAVGAGELSIVTKAGSVQSEPYSLWDTLMYDNGGTDLSKWNTSKGSGLVITYPNNEYTNIANTNVISSNSSYLLGSVTLTGDFEATLEVIIPSFVGNVGQYFGIRDSTFTKQTIWRATETGWRYYKIRRVNGEWSGFVKVNESDNWQTISPQYNQITTEDGTFCFTIYNPRNETYEIGFKNLKIYSI